MESFEKNVREIKRHYQLIFGKECDVHFTFKGTSLGLVKCWNVKIDNREANHTKIELATLELLSQLQAELYNKISRLEEEARHLRSALGDVNN